MEKRVEDLFCFVINISNECVLKYLPYLDRPSTVGRCKGSKTFNPKIEKKLSHGSRVTAHRRRGTTSTTGHWAYY